MSVRSSDIKNYLQLWKDSCAARGVGDRSEEIIRLNEILARVIFEHDQAAQERKSIDYKNLRHPELSKIIENKRSEKNKIESQITDILDSMPNWVHKDVPRGKSDKDNLEIKRSEVKSPGKGVKHQKAKGYLSALAGEICGARMYVFAGDLALLEVGLTQFLVNHYIKRGFSYYSLPSIVNDSCMYRAAKLPKFAEDSYVVNGKWLISTGEIPLICCIKNLFENPCQKLITCTPCYRKEAGAAGKDNEGWVRQHQFTKIELVASAVPTQSDEVFDELCNEVEQMLNMLGLFWRKMYVCAGDMGAGAYRQIDFEVWLCGQERWIEVASVSDCYTYQSYRMKLKSKDKIFLHTFNGTGGAVGRLLAAIIEHYSVGAKKIRLPRCLEQFVQKSELDIF